MCDFHPRAKHVPRRKCDECALLAAGFTLREIRGVEVWTRPVEPVRPRPAPTSIPGPGQPRDAYTPSLWWCAMPALVVVAVAAVLALLS